MKGVATLQFVRILGRNHRHAIAHGPSVRPALVLAAAAAWEPVACAFAARRALLWSAERPPRRAL